MCNVGIDNDSENDDDDDDTLLDYKMMSWNVQNSSGTTSRRQVVSLQSFEHFMVSFYGL